VNPKKLFVIVVVVGIVVVSREGGKQRQQVNSFPLSDLAGGG